MSGKLKGAPEGIPHPGGASASPTKVSISDTETYENKKKFILYKVVVAVGGRQFFIFRRYNEFSTLYEKLKKQFPDANLKLPGKRLFGNFDSSFIKQRRYIDGLHNFVQIILSRPDMLQLPEVVEFLGLDKQPEVSGEQEDEEEDMDVDSVNRSGSSDASASPKGATPPVGTTPQHAPGKKALPEANGNDEAANVINLGESENAKAKPSDFEFLKVIGKGSFGKVLLAKHKTEKTVYAVKVLNKVAIMKRNEARHIMSERNVLLKNIKHPFLVSLRYSFQTNDKLYFVLDYVNGGELFFHLQKERHFSEQRAKFYAAEIASAIAYLHSQNIIYRDLKPENLLLDSDGHIKLTDFGLCKENIGDASGKRTEADAPMKSTTSTFCGTPEYLAPEVLRKQPYTKAVDWWCLGAVLYEMLFGLPPFYSRDTAKMYDAILHEPLRIRNSVSRPAQFLLDGLLQKNPSNRLGTANDFGDLVNHEFFASISWPDLEAKRIKPPYNPNVKGPMDLSQLDPEFTREAVPQSVGRSVGVISASVQEANEEFVGFTYVPPSEEAFDLHE